MTPTISLIMTVYNRPHYLKDAIESVLTQTRKDFQLLILDDGSTDNSLDIAHHYASIDNRIQLIKRPHTGRAPSLKAAHTHCQGTYIGWIDSDDLLTPTTLSETANILDTQPKIGLVYTDYLIIDAHSNVKGIGQRCSIPYSKSRLLIDFMNFHFRLYRRDIYDKAGGIDETMEMAEDYDLCLRISEITSIKHLEKPLYYYRIHSENLSHKQIEQIHWSAIASRRAIERRGLADTYDLDVQIIGRFSLRHKNKPLP